MSESQSFDVYVVAPSTDVSDLIIGGDTNITGQTISVGINEDGSTGAVGSAVYAMTQTTQANLPTLVTNIGAATSPQATSSVFFSGPLPVAGAGTTTASMAEALNTVVAPTGAVGVVGGGLAVPGGSTVVHSLWVGDHEDYTPLAEGEANIEGDLHVDGDVSVDGDFTGTANFLGDVNVGGTLTGTTLTVTNLTVTGTVDIAGTLPVGAITMWFGTVAAIPTGWVLCDGTAGTPDLVGRFPRGTVTEGDLGNTGGADDVTLTVGQLASHTHGGSTTDNGIHVHGIPPESGAGIGETVGFIGSGVGTDIALNVGLVTASGVLPPGGMFSTASDGSTARQGGHTHSILTNSAGSGDPIDIVPSYAEVMFIMRIA